MFYCSARPPKEEDRDMPGCVRVSGACVCEASSRRWRLGAFILALALLACGCNSIRPPQGMKSVSERITVTGYCDCGSCCSWERSWLRFGMPVYSYGPLKGQRKEVGVTSTGTKTRHGTAAVDRTRYPYGTIFYVPGYGYARGEDAGGAIKGKHIDLWFPSHSAALQWGRKTLTVDIWRPAR